MSEHRIAISSFNWAKRNKRNFDRIISCYDPDTKRNHVLRFHQPDAPALLRLRFVDLDDPPPEQFRDQLLARMPQRGDVEKALAFDRPGENLLIHCRVGVSRSTALAIAILAARREPGEEGRAICDVLHLRPQAVPNLAIIRHADDILDRHGRLVDALNRAESADWTKRRIENREAYLAHFERCFRE
jgi:predicted protein tyrosine phosphatase